MADQEAADASRMLVSRHGRCVGCQDRWPCAALLSDTPRHIRSTICCHFGDASMHTAPSTPEHPSAGSPTLHRLAGAQVAAVVIPLVVGSAGLHDKVVAGRAFLGLVGGLLLLGDGRASRLAAALEAGLVGDDLAHVHRQAGACAGAQKYSSG